MPLVEKVRHVSLTRNQYQEARGRGATVTLGHVPYGATLADLPAAITMEPGKVLTDDVIEDLVRRLMRGPLQRDHVANVKKSMEDLAEHLAVLTGPEQADALSRLQLAVDGLQAFCAATARNRTAAPNQALATAPTELDRAAAIARLREHRTHLQATMNTAASITATSPSMAAGDSASKSAAVKPLPEFIQAGNPASDRSITPANLAPVEARECITGKPSPQEGTAASPSSRAFRARDRLRAWVKRAQAMLAVCARPTFIVHKLLGGG